MNARIEHTFDHIGNDNLITNSNIPISSGYHKVVMKYLATIQDYISNIQQSMNLR